MPNHTKNFPGPTSPNPIIPSFPSCYISLRFWTSKSAKLIFVWNMSLAPRDFAGAWHTEKKICPTPSAHSLQDNNEDFLMAIWPGECFFGPQTLWCNWPIWRSLLNLFRIYAENNIKNMSTGQCQVWPLEALGDNLTFHEGEQEECWQIRILVCQSASCAQKMCWYFKHFVKMITNVFVHYLYFP